MANYGKYRIMTRLGPILPRLDFAISRLARLWPKASLYMYMINDFVISMKFVLHGMERNSSIANKRCVVISNAASTRPILKCRTCEVD